MLLAKAALGKSPRSIYDQGTSHSKYLLSMGMEVRLVYATRVCGSLTDVQ